MAVADAVLQRDPPAPSGRHGDRLGIGHERPGARGRQGDGAVARQPPLPAVEADAESTRDQQGAEARAVDEQVAGDPLPCLEPEGGDAVARALDLDDAPLGTDHAPGFGEAAEPGGVAPGVDVEGVGHGGQRRCRQRLAAVHPAAPRRRFVQREAAQRAGQRQRTSPLPIVLERDQPDVPADVAEGVHVALARRTPADELDAELERAAAGAEHRVLVEAEGGVEGPHLRDRRFTDTDRADIVRFDEADLETLLEEAAERGGDHPAGGTAAGDDDAHGVRRCRSRCHALPLHAGAAGRPAAPCRVRTCRRGRDSSRGRSAGSRSPAVGRCSGR